MSVVCLPTPRRSRYLCTPAVPSDGSRPLCPVAGCRPYAHSLVRGYNISPADIPGDNRGPLPEIDRLSWADPVRSLYPGGLAALSYINSRMTFRTLRFPVRPRVPPAQWPDRYTVALSPTPRVRPPLRHRAHLTSPRHDWTSSFRPTAGTSGNWSRPPRPDGPDRTTPTTSHRSPIPRGLGPAGADTCRVWNDVRCLRTGRTVGINRANRIPRSGRLTIGRGSHLRARIGRESRRYPKNVATLWAGTGCWV